MYPIVRTIYIPVGFNRLQIMSEVKPEVLSVTLNNISALTMSLLCKEDVCSTLPLNRDPSAKPKDFKEWGVITLVAYDGEHIKHPVNDMDFVGSICRFDELFHVWVKVI